MNVECKKIHGFTLQSVSRVEEIDANVAEYIHEGSGARLIYLDRKDENKTFAIGFKTLPEDDTGVFHILEHSVLCGSRKFPVKDPFTELLKGSLYTYLNAFTYPDKTIYPVSSKNAKAFLDLINVYMDAVLHPLALTNENIFLQEGFRYETEDDGTLKTGGVVYNEMKGAYSSPDELADYYISRELYRGSPYAFDSGGNPESIPNLSYQQFKEAHARFYHPSNSVIFLDGSLELQGVLSLIDSYLSEYERCDILLPDLSFDDVNTTPRVEFYPLDSEENEDGKTRVSLAYRLFSHSDTEKNLAMSLITDALADTNGSPLKKEILSHGLCKNFYLSYSSFNPISQLTAQFIDVKDGKENELIELFDRAINKITEQGIDRELIEASLESTEFKTREADFGSFPRGMVYMIACFERAFYGEDTPGAYTYNAQFTRMRERLGTDYFDTLLKAALSKKRVTLVMKPDKGYAKRSEGELKAKLDKKLESMSEQELEMLKKQSEGLNEWQSTPDSDEALSKIPRLSLSDLSDAPKPTPTAISKRDGVTVVTHDIEASGIVYAELMFDASDIPACDLSSLLLFTSVMRDLRTASGESSVLGSKIKRHLGELSISPVPIKNKDDGKIYIAVKLSALKTKAKWAAELLYEYLYTSDFNDLSSVKRRLEQLYIASSENIVVSATSYSLLRVGARYDTLHAIKEKLYGYDAHMWLKTMSQASDEELYALINKLDGMREKFFRRERLTLGITEGDEKEFSDSLISVIKTGGTPSGKCEVKTNEIRNEGIAVSAEVGYSAYGSNLMYSKDNRYTGAFTVLGTIMTYEILWNEIRVRGSAYDTGFILRAASGAVQYYSYRDPSPERSVEFFKKAQKSLRDFLGTSPDLTRFIISTVGATGTVGTPRSDASAATTLYLSGKSHSDVIKSREEAICATTDELCQLSEKLDELTATSSFCIIAPRSMLDDGKLDKILEI